MNTTMRFSLEQTTRELRTLEEETPISWHTAALSMNVLFSLFPLLLVVVSVFGFLGEQPRRATMMLDRLQALLPPDVFALSADTLERFFTTDTTAVFSVGFLLLLWSASRTMRTLTKSLNRIYRNTSRRRWIEQAAIAVAFTLLLGIVFFLSSNLLVWGDAFVPWLTHNFTWAILFLLVTATSLLAYRFLPSHDVETSWHHHLPGALTATAAWMLGSFLFSLYLSSLPRFQIYGAIGTVIVLILYIQLSSYAFLVGAYLNSVWETLGQRGLLRRWVAGVRKVVGQ